MKPQPDFAFTLPSLFDGIPIDCRIYIPEQAFQQDRSKPKGAIFAHPYAPLGGSYDDLVVLAVAKCLLDQGFFVATFNFRGAGESEGRTSWTGRPEIDDYASVVGFMCFYLDHLSECSKSSSERPEGPAVEESETGHSATYQLILGGYSFGSLIVAKLPSVTDIVGLFESSKRSASAVAILDRALTLSTRWRERLLAELEDGKPARSQHKKKLSLDHAMPHTVGGDERSPSRKREHHIRDIPQMMKHTIRRHSNPSRMKAAADSESAPVIARKHTTFEIHVRYLLVSPVLVPLSTFLPPLGLPSLFALLGLHDRTTDDKSAGFMSLTTSTLVLFGTEDNFTSAKKLQQWAEKLEQRADGRMQWFALDGAGHFWRESGAIAALKAKISLWASQPT